MKLGRPFLPMLCYRNMRNLSDIVKMMMTRRKPGPEPDPSNPYFCNPDEFLVEEKLDGERLLMHKMGDSYRWFSRCVCFECYVRSIRIWLTFPMRHAQDLQRLHLRLWPGCFSRLACAVPEGLLHSGNRRVRAGATSLCAFY